MIWKTTILVVLFLNNLTSTLAQSKCCGGQNILNANKKCVEGVMKELACESKFMTYINSSEVTIKSDNSLVFMEYDETLPPDQYCLTKSQKDNRDILAMCYEEVNDEEVRVINVGLSFVSVVFIILTICVYLSLPEILDTQGLCAIQSITGLALSFIILGIINLSGFIPYHQCRLLAYVMYFSFLYAFFWLNVLCFHIWRNIVNPKILRFTRNWKLIYHAVGTGGPLILLLFLLTANYSGYEFFDTIHPQIGEVKCWFIDSTTTWIYFYGPISVLLCINIIYFAWTIVILCHNMNNCSEKKAKVQKYRLLFCVKLFFVMGIPWCFEVISALLENSTSKWLWFVTDSINALQGFFIFLILVVLRKKVIRALANKKLFRCIKFPASWKNVQDDECEELEEELSLSGTHDKKPDIPA